MDRGHGHLRNTVMSCLGINEKPFHGYYVEGDREERLFPILAEAIEASIQLYNEEKDAYHTALTRILKWARDNSTKNTYDDGSVTRLFLRRSFELFQILADAGFEIDPDDDLVIHGERVRDDE